MLVIDISVSVSTRACVCVPRYLLYVQKLPPPLLLRLFSHCFGGGGDRLFSDVPVRAATARHPLL